MSLLSRLFCEWKRLLTISAEDCWGGLTAEIKALHESYVFVNKGRARSDTARPHLRPESRDFALRGEEEPETPITCKTTCIDALADIDADELAAELLKAGRKKFPSMRSTATR